MQIRFPLFVCSRDQRFAKIKSFFYSTLLEASTNNCKRHNWQHSGTFSYWSKKCDFKARTMFRQLKILASEAAATVSKSLFEILSPVFCAVLVSSDKLSKHTLEEREGTEDQERLTSAVFKGLFTVLLHTAQMSRIDTECSIILKVYSVVCATYI